MDNANILKKSESVLTAKKIYVETVNFRRNRITNGLVRFNNNSVGKSIEKLEDETYKCSLMIKMRDEEDATELDMTVSGIFEFKSEIDENQKEIIITKNTMSILFPYLRTQVTLMTAQPDIEPVVIPVININALLQNMEEQ